MNNHNEPSIYEVVAPLGQPAFKAGCLAPRLPDLNGKTICEVSNGLFKGESTFPKIRGLLKKQYPDVKIIPYTKFPILDIAQIERSLEALKDALAQQECDALISGNGG